MFTGKIDLQDLDTSISEFLAWESISRDTIDVKRVYCDIAGDLVSGVLLSQIIYWHLPDKNGDSRLSVDRADHLWLAKSYPDWWEECRVTEKQARRAIRVLVDRGIIEVGKWQFNGAPTTHIRINWIPSTHLTFLNIIGIKLLIRLVTPISDIGNTDLKHLTNQHQYL